LSKHAEGKYNFRVTTRGEIAIPEAYAALQNISKSTITTKSLKILPSLFWLLSFALLLGGELLEMVGCRSNGACWR